jgi:hypothetical protein
MSHRISLEEAKELRVRDLELQQMQKEGKPLPKSGRRQKKYLLQIKKQKGFFKYLSERHKLHGHKEVSKSFEELAEEE